MLAIGERRDAMVGQARRATPDDDVAVLQRNAPGPVAAAHTAEQEYRRQAERNRDDRRRQIAFVFVAMQRQPGYGLIPVDQASVGFEPGEARGISSTPGQIAERSRDRRPAAAG